MVNQRKPQIGLVEDEIDPHYLVVGSGSTSRRVAYLRRAQKPGTTRPGIVWLGGFRSDMRGVKAAYLDRFAAETGRAYLRFDYSGMACQKALSKGEPSGHGSKKASTPFAF
jgi:hypothetical protein